MTWFRHAKPVALLLLLAGLVFFLRFGPRPSLFEAVAYRATGGLARAQRNTLLPYGDNETLKKKLLRAREENMRLHAETAALRTQLKKFQFTAAMRGPETPRNAVAAAVAGRDPATWSEALVVDQGARQGVHAGYVALGYGGLAGRVVRVTDDTAIVRLITGPGAATNCRVERTGVHCIAKGNGTNLLRIEYIPRRADVRLGDRIFTSGLGRNYPVGHYIGKVRRVDRSQAFLTAQVTARTAVDFDRLEFLLLVPRRL